MKLFIICRRADDSKDDVANSNRHIERCVEPFLMQFSRLHLHVPSKINHHLLPKLHFFPIHFCVKLASVRGEFDSFFRSNGLQQNVFAVSNPNKCFLRFVTKDAFALTSLRMYALYSTEQSECMHYILLNRASIHHSLQLV